MARVLAPYGIHGWIKARPLHRLDRGACWITRRGGWHRPVTPTHGRSFAVRSARQHGDTLVAALDGVDAIAKRPSSGAARGWRCLARRCLAPQAGEFYWSDLVGLTVVNRAAETLGRVKQVAGDRRPPGVACRVGGRRPNG